MGKSKESWRVIHGSGGFYSINNLGIIKSSERVVNLGIRHLNRRPHLCYRTQPEKIIKSRKMPSGYISTYLCIKKLGKTHLLHRVLWEAFNGPILKGLQINHKNGIRHDNRLENLELVTSKQNHWHKNNILKNHQRGEKNGRAKLSGTDALKIKKEYIPRINSLNFLAKKYNVSKKCILNIIQNKSYQ